uniref:Uncharacterized protein n=1 Tax=Oryza nivara TaxID=4536 RepID=A0A0E0FGX6_ORYNI
MELAAAHAASAQRAGARRRWQPLAPVLLRLPPPELLLLLLLPPPPQPARPHATAALPVPSMSKNVDGARPAGGQEAAKAAMVAMELDNRRAC